MAPKNNEERAFIKDVPYRQLVGALMYLAVATCLDIAHLVEVLAHFSTDLGPTHWKALKHLCCYVQGTKDYKLSYAPDPCQSEMFLTFADVDFGSDMDSKHSTSGMVVKMGTGAISWRSQLQTIITLSTTEAEYISAVAAAQEIVWLCNLFLELGYETQSTSTLYLDNQSAIAVSRNPEHHGHMKHLDLHHYWLRDVCKASIIDVKYLLTKSMPADIITKTLSHPSVMDMKEMLGLRG